MKLITTHEEALRDYDQYFKEHPYASGNERVSKARGLHEIYGDVILPGLLERINRDVAKVPGGEFKSLSGKGFIEVFRELPEFPSAESYT